MPGLIGRPALEAIGVRLRDLRRDAGLTGRSLAQRCGWPPSKVSKLEYGRQVPSEQDVRDWCVACGLTSEIPDLVTAVRSVEAQLVDLRRALRTGTRARQRKNVSAYERTSLFRVWEPVVVPGLLQTREYAREVLATVVDFYGIPDDVEDGVRFRLDAQRVLSRSDRRFLLLLGEAALYTAVGDTAVMHAQLERLLDVARLRHVVLGVVPQDAPYTVPRNNGFTMYDDRSVTLATYTAELTLTQRHEIAVYGRAFDRLLALAHTASAAERTIRVALDRLRER